jgi:hypothetical protein
MEETMRVLTIIELMRLTRMQLCDLRLRITCELDGYPEGSYEREAALAGLRVRFSVDTVPPAWCIEMALSNGGSERVARGRSGGQGSAIAVGIEGTTT